MISAFSLFLAAVICSVALGKSVLWAILLGLVIFFLLGLRRGYRPAALWSMAWKKGREALVIIPVFLLIGTVTALWRASGTIAFFLYYGLGGIPHRWFLLAAFLLTAALSFALGTSYGVTGTAGVVLMTLARSGGVPAAMTAGAVLSGAYFGDRCSPMSSCAALVALCTRTEFYRNVREMLRTAALPTVLTAVFYAVLSVRSPIAEVNPQVLETLRGGFRLCWPVLLPAALMLALPLLRVPVKWAMAASSCTALAVTVLVQRLPIAEALWAAVAGYVPPQPELAGILSGGGLCSMVPASLIVFVTSLYSGILEGIDALSPVRAAAERLTARIGLFPAMAAVSTLVVAVFCNQSVAVIMDEQLMAESYERRGASRLERAMDISNSGVLIASLIPWSISVSVPLRMLDADSSAILFTALLYLIPLCYLFTKKFFAPAWSGARART